MASASCPANQQGLPGFNDDEDTVDIVSTRPTIPVPPIPSHPTGIKNTLKTKHLPNRPSKFLHTPLKTK